MARKKKAPKLEELIPDEAKRKEVLSRLYQGDRLLGDGGIFTDMLQAMVNAALEGEMDHHLEESRKAGKGNRRNGHTRKAVRSEGGPLDIKTPRDRLGEHEPQLIGKWDRELSSGMDEVILSLYARGQSVEDVRTSLLQIYGVDLSAGAISKITDRVWEEIQAWQERPLARCYPVVYLDALHYRVRHEREVQNKAVYTIYGVTAEGQRDVLGMYLGLAEGAREWGLVLEDLRRRGVEEVFFFCVDGLQGLRQVIAEVFPQSLVQRCIVHMVRTSVRFVPDKDRKAVCADLRKVYSAANREEAAVKLDAFGAKWDAKYREIRPKWEASWEELMAFMDYREPIRKMIYTTNPVEALHRILRKVTKAKGAWSNDKGLIKQLYLALKYNEKGWKRKAYQWTSIQRELLAYFGERYEKYLTP